MMDYPELIAEVVTISGDGSVPTRAAMFTMLAENDLAKRLQVGDTELSETVMTDQNGEVDLPKDFGQMREIFTASGQRLKQALMPTVHEVNSPSYYIQGRTLKTTVKSSELRLEYYATIPPLAIYGTNWLIEREPAIYRQALLFQVYDAQENDEKAARAAARLGQLIDDYRRDDERRRFDGLTYQSDRIWP